MNQKNKFVQKVKIQKKKNEVEFQQLKVHIISIVMKLDDLNKKILQKFYIQMLTSNQTTLKNEGNNTWYPLNFSFIKAAKSNITNLNEPEE